MTTWRWVQSTNAFPAEYIFFFNLADSNVHGYIQMIIVRVGQGGWVSNNPCSFEKLKLAQMLWFKKISTKKIMIQTPLPKNHLYLYFFLVMTLHMFYPRLSSAMIRQVNFEKLDFNVLKIQKFFFIINQN